MPIRKPAEGDYNPYFAKYIESIPEGDLIRSLTEEAEQTTALFGSLSEEQGAYKYGEGKWSIKQVLGHASDTERIMSYRLLRVSRGDETPLPGFDENLFANNADSDRSTIGDLLEEYRAVRASTIALLKGLSEEQLDRAGIVSGGRTTARSLAYIIAGHASHHMNVIRERYLPGLR